MEEVPVALQKSYLDSTLVRRSRMSGRRMSGTSRRSPRHFLNSDFPWEIQWNPKYGCRGTVRTRFALIALVAWKCCFDSTLRKLSVQPKYG